MQRLDGYKLAHALGVPVEAGQFLAGQFNELLRRLDAAEARIAELESACRIR